MKKTGSLLVVAVLAATAGVVSYLSLNNKTGQAATQRIDFQLTDLDGQPRQASEWDGKIVLINFWAPWCAPCRAEVPLLIDLQNRFAEKGLRILGPALDQPDAVKRFADEYGINYVLFAELNAVMDLQEAYGDSRLPYTVLLDQNGDIAFRHAGELKAVTIEAQIQRLIGEEDKSILR